MNDQNLRNKWTEENISYLKYAYLKGSPLKQIAASLNRSVSAINKVLAPPKPQGYSTKEECGGTNSKENAPGSFFS
jgi:transposase